MHTVQMDRDYDYRPGRQSMTAYKAGKTYSKVPNAAAEAIVAAGAGRIIPEVTGELRAADEGGSAAPGKGRRGGR